MLSYFSSFTNQYLAKNNYENYSPKLALVAKFWGLAHGLLVSMATASSTVIMLTIIIDW